MSDLAKAAGSGVTDQVGNLTWEFRPIDLKDLGALERQALKHYKDEVIESYVQMVGKYLPENIRVQEIRAKMNEVALMDVDVLREKDVEVVEEDKKSGKIVHKKERIPYASWWMTRTFEGMLHFVWYSARKSKPGLTLEHVAADISNAGGQKKLNELAQLVDDISSPGLVGN